MEIKQKDNGKTGMFYIEIDNQVVAKMDYSWSATDRILITHTEVNDVLKGKGAGKQLVAKSVDFAREKHIKIVPLCSFARRVFDTVKEFNDVL
ncbi:MAG: GNAT family N-acetyltransferase [Bacteroidia bacterium]